MSAALNLVKEYSETSLTGSNMLKLVNTTIIQCMHITCNMQSKWRVTKIVFK